jgi:preprotein translocase subunit SecY
MFSMLKQITKKNNKDIRDRVLFTLLALFIFSVGTHIRVPGTKDITANLGFLELINAMGGGALKQFSIFATGVIPYITASIIIQLLQMDIVPYLTELSKQGEAGRRKINQLTRYFGIFIAFIQGYIFSFAFIGTGQTALEYMRYATILTAGTAFLLWLGDQITQKGFGNGISLIIMAGIINTLPTMFIDAFRELINPGGHQGLLIGIILFTLFVIIYFVIIIGVIFVQEAARRIPIQYSNRTVGAYGKEQNYMPIRINSAGVIPVIFASTIIALPATVSQLSKNAKVILFIEKYLSYQSTVGFSLYLLFILFFTYFYTFLQLKPDELSKNLHNQGGYIPGIRPGKETSAYIKQVLSRLTLVGGFFLMIIAGLPIIFTSFTNLPTSITIGGTGLLIVVGVALETYKQLESTLVSRTYKRGYRRR